MLHIEDISDCDISTDINQNRETKIQIYPNPVKDSYLYVKLPEDRITDYSADVTDIFGHILRHFDLVSSVEGFNLNSLSSGIYLIKIYDKNQIVLSDKIIKL